MSNKLVDNKRRSHAEKVLQQLSKRVSQPGSSANASSSTSSSSANQQSVIEPLKDQYQVIRKDILKLRDDLSKGYDMAKQVVEKKGLFRQLLSLK